ncbi:MAG: NAD(P)H-dependent oxidoreductase [Neoaquamicrobium sediminum]|uniref:NAD(P)H-dependent oxidoreductase n=1 Tax=Neoaquamicrobium sediminum TaxID=1849104 RepID=UPI00403677A7
MSRRILVVTAHPDPAPERLCRALAEAYASGAEKAGHQVRRVDIARLEFPLLRSTDEFVTGEVPEALRDAAESIVWAEHIVFVFPLWLGTMPAHLKAFLEQVMRPGIAFRYDESGTGFAETLLTGRSARLVVTMAMPPMMYRLWFMGHGIATLRRSILNFVGIKPVRETLFGTALSSLATRTRWLRQMESLGKAGR